MEKYVDSSTSALSPPTVSVKSGMLAVIAGHGGGSGPTVTVKVWVTGSQPTLATVTEIVPVPALVPGETSSVVPVRLAVATDVSDEDIV